MEERRWVGVKTILYFCACLAMFLAIYRLYQEGKDLERTRVRVGQIPAEAFSLQNMPGAKPAVVIAHGFSTSRQYMYPFAYTLAKNGYIAVVFDFSGHGKNPQVLPYDWSGRHGDPGALNQDLGAIVDYVRQLPGVDPDRLALLGYSMGSAAVSQYARDHDHVQATVAVSSVFSDVLPAKPRNLLLLTGAWELSPMKETARAALASSGGGAEGVQNGDFSAGTARKLVFVPNVEHVMIPYSRVTLTETLNWLNAAFGHSGNGYLDGRLGWVGLFFFSALVVFLPFSRLLLEGRFERGQSSALEISGVLLAAGLPALITPLVLRALPYRILPLAVGDYLASFFLLQGLLMFVLLLAIGALDGQGLAHLLARRAVWAAFLLFLYFAMTFGLMTEFTLLTFLPIPRRFAIIGAAFLAVAPYFVASEYISRTDFPGYNQLFPLLTKVLLLLSLGGGILLGAPFVLTLFLPALALLFIFCGFLSRRIYRLTGHPGIGGLFTAMVFAWLLAVIFPIT